MKPRLQAVKKQLLVQKRLIELHGHCGWGETCRAISYAQEQQVISDSDAMQLWRVLQDGNAAKHQEFVRGYRVLAIWTETVDGDEVEQRCAGEILASECIEIGTQPWGEVILGCHHQVLLESGVKYWFPSADLTLLGRS